MASQSRRAGCAWDRGAAGTEALVHAYEARDPDGAGPWVDATIDRFGRIDAVVANAGIMMAKTVIEAEDHEFDDLMEVNVKAPRRLLKAAWPALKRCGRGRVVTVVSLSGLRVASAGSGLYATSKFAALGLPNTAAIAEVPVNWTLEPLL